MGARELNQYGLQVHGFYGLSCLSIFLTRILKTKYSIVELTTSLCNVSKNCDIKVKSMTDYF